MICACEKELCTHMFEEMIVYTYSSYEDRGRHTNGMKVIKKNDIC